MKKKRLMTPGPTQVPEAALLTLARQVTHHRTPEFQSLFTEVTQGLREIFQTQGDILLLSGSGTAAMEAAVVNAVPRGGRALCLVSGKFSERWAEMCQAFGITPVIYDVPWGEPFDPAVVRKHVEKDRSIQAIYTTLCETSTGVGHDIEGISQALDTIDFTADLPRPLLVVDGISAVGAVACRTDAWKIDLLCVGGQKALMGLAGLALLAVSPTAWERIERISRPVFYFDLLKYRKNAKNNDTPFTPPKSLIDALAVSIHALRTEGIENVWRRISRLAGATRAGLRASGLSLVPQRPSDAMTVCRIPEQVDSKKFLTLMEQRFGVKFAGGQGKLKGKIFRLAHFGIIDEFDIIGMIGSVELALHALGYPVSPGTGVAAALAVLVR